MLTPVYWLPQYKSGIQITWCSYQCCHRGGGDRYPSTSLEYRSHGAVISVIIGGWGDRCWFLSVGYPSTSLEYKSHGAVISPGQMLVPVCWLPQYQSGIQITWYSYQCCHRGVGGQIPQYKSRIQITWCSYQCCHRGGGGDRYPSTSLEYRSHGAVISFIIGGWGDRCWFLSVGYPSTSLEYKSHGAVISPGQMLVPVCWLPQYQSGIQITWCSHQCCHRGVRGEMLTPVCWLPQYKSGIQITWCSYQCCHGGGGWLGGGQMLVPVCWLPQYKSGIQITWCSYQCCHGGGQQSSTEADYRADPVHKCKTGMTDFCTGRSHL